MGGQAGDWLKWDGCFGLYGVQNIQNGIQNYSIGIIKSKVFEEHFICAKETCSW